MTYCQAKDAYGGTCGNPENYFDGLCAEHRIADLEAELEAFRGKPSGKDDVATAVELLHEWKARAEKAEAELAATKAKEETSFVSYKTQKARAEKAEAEVERLRARIRLAVMDNDVKDLRPIALYEGGGRESGDQGPGSVPGRPGRSAAIRKERDG